MTNIANLESTLSQGFYVHIWSECVAPILERHEYII